MLGAEITRDTCFRRTNAERHPRVHRAHSSRRREPASVYARRSHLRRMHRRLCTGSSSTERYRGEALRVILAPAVTRRIFHASHFLVTDTRPPGRQAAAAAATWQKELTRCFVYALARQYAHAATPGGERRIAFNGTRQIGTILRWLGLVAFSDGAVLRENVPHDAAISRARVPRNYPGDKPARIRDINLQVARRTRTVARVEERDERGRECRSITYMKLSCRAGGKRKADEYVSFERGTGDRRRDENNKRGRRSMKRRVRSRETGRTGTLPRHRGRPADILRTLISLICQP